MNVIQSNDTIKATARLAGVVYLTLFISGIVAEFFVRTSLIVPGDALVTASQIGAAPGLFRIGIVADLVMIVSDILLAILFYQILKPVSATLSAIAAAFRLTQAMILGINLLNLYLVLELVGGAPYLAPLAGGTAEALALFFANAHDTGYALGLVFFGVSLAFVGYLTIRAEYLPTILGALLLVAALGYLTDSMARTVLLDYERFAPIFDTVVFVPAFVSELAMSLWLVIRGVRTVGTPAQPVAA